MATSKPIELEERRRDTIVQFEAHMDLCFCTLGNKDERYNLRQLVAVAVVVLFAQVVLLIARVSRVQNGDSIIAT